MGNVRGLRLIIVIELSFAIPCRYQETLLEITISHAEQTE